jgi:hypothetical protein
VSVQACGIPNAPASCDSGRDDRPASQLLLFDSCLCSWFGVHARNLIGDAGLLPPLLLALLLGLLVPGESIRFGSGLRVSNGWNNLASSGVDEGPGSNVGVRKGDWWVGECAFGRLGVEVEPRMSVDR